MKIITRKEAKRLGLSRYFTGKPCIYGHTDERNTANGACYACQRKKQLVCNMTPEQIEKKHRYQNLAAPWDNATRLKRIPAWSEKEAIEEFYKNCPPGHHVDHIIPLKGKLVSGLHVLSNLQYLPAIENIRKSNRYTIE